jgi:hypothetical protein
MDPVGGNDGVSRVVIAEVPAGALNSGELSNDARRMSRIRELHILLE